MSDEKKRYQYILDRQPIMLYLSQWLDLDTVGLRWSSVHCTLIRWISYRLDGLPSQNMQMKLNNQVRPCISFSQHFLGPSNILKILGELFFNPNSKVNNTCKRSVLFATFFLQVSNKIIIMLFYEPIIL